LKYDELAYECRSQIRVMCDGPNEELGTKSFAALIPTYILALPPIDAPNETNTTLYVYFDEK
jgi:hypothetical protein